MLRCCCALLLQTMHVEVCTIQVQGWDQLAAPTAAAEDADATPCVRWVPEAALSAQGLTTGVRKVLNLAAGKR